MWQCQQPIQRLSGVHEGIDLDMIRPETNALAYFDPLPVIKKKS
jgi:hypothetical protein